MNGQVSENFYHREHREETELTEKNIEISVFSVFSVSCLCALCVEIVVFYMPIQIKSALSSKVSEPGSYSYRKAIIGSTLVARLAGR
jgi:hypothetical protein